MYRTAFLIITTAFLATACSKEPVEVYDPAHDYFSFANTEQFVTRHLELDLTVDFDKEQLRGSAVLHMEQLDPLATEIILDSRGLDIASVSISVADGESIPVEFLVGEEDAVLGSPVTITLPADIEIVADFALRLDYATGKNASALQWLPPEFLYLSTR